MNDLQKHFLAESINKLTVLQRDLSAGLSENTRLEAFRAFHTIKGTAQTFGLSQAGNLAHSLENLLSAGKNNSISDRDLQSILDEGIENLTKSLAEKNYQIPDSYKNKIAEHSAALEKTDLPIDYSAGIPVEFSAPLSTQEKALLNDVLAGGKHLYILEIGFKMNVFAVNYKAFREELMKNGEIIAALPSRKYSSEGKIGFQVICATFEDSENIAEIFGKYGAKIIYRTFRETSFDLPGVLSQIVAHGKTTAENLGKNVEYEFEIEAENVSDENLKLIFDTFLHLVRNAIDHGVEKTGKIILGVKKTGSDLLLTVSDDGKGLDTEKIKSKAVAASLIQNDVNLTAEEIANLIFTPEFSTAESVTEISGRGVGLDAVKNIVENAGGRISVKSERGKGARFEILLSLQI